MVDDPVSEFGNLEGVADLSLSTAPVDDGGGGGSMTDGAGEGLESGSGSAGMASSGEEVSMVICFVVGGDCRKV